MSYLRIYPAPSGAFVTVPITLTRVAASAGNLASFGVPFAAGVLTQTRQLTAGGRSLFVTPTLYWYNASGVATSIKAARIQLVMPESSLAITLSTATPQAVDWPLASTAFADVSTALTHTVQVADYTIAYDNTTYTLPASNTRTLDLFDTREPCVVASFESYYLASTGLFGPLLTSAQVAADSTLAGVKYLSDYIGPCVRAAMYISDWTVEAASVTVPLPYEGYLYDRAATFLLAYAHTNAADVLRPSYRYAWSYQSLIKLDAPQQGVWTGKPASGGIYDTKYSHARGLYYYYALTGDEGALAALTAIGNLWRDDAYTSVPYQNGALPSSTATWTERELACALEGTFYGFLTTGTASYLTAHNALFETAYTHISTQNQATLDAITKPWTSGGVTYNFPPQNALIHNGDQQDESTGATPWVSSWMTELLVAPLLAYLAQSGDTRVYEFFVRLGRFLRDTGTAYTYTPGTFADDYFLAPQAAYTIPGSRRLFAWYGSGRRKDNTRYTRYTSDIEHTPDTSALTAIAQRSLVARPDLDQGAMTPFASERACAEAMHHEISYTARGNIAAYDLGVRYYDPSRPTGTYHSQSRLAAAYNAGQAAIDKYILDFGVGHVRMRIAPDRKVSWWLNNSMLQFGLMRDAGFSLPTIIQGWVGAETPYTPASFEEVTASTGLTALIAAWRAEEAAKVPAVTGWFPTSIVSADFAGTGRPDIVLSSHGVPGSRVFSCTGYDVNGVPLYADYTIARTLSGAFSATYADGSAYVMDYNGDGYPDILFAGDEGTSTPSQLALNDGTGQFAITDIAVEAAQLRMAASPTTGLVDIVGVYGQYDDFSFYANDGDGTYTKGLTAPHGEWGPFTTAMRLANMVGSSAVTFENAAGKLQVNWPANLLRNGRVVRFRVTPGGVLPSPLVAGTDYYVTGKPTSATVPFQVTTVYGQPSIDFVDAGTSPIEGYFDLERPTVRTVDLGTVIGTVLLVSFGQASDASPDRQSFVLRDSGGGVYTDITASLGLPTGKFFFAGVYDFDNDGLLDLLITDNVLGGIYLNDGAGQLVLRTDELATDIAAQTVQGGCVTMADVADFNEDGKPEILLQHYRYGYYSRLYQNIGKQYARVYTFPTFSQHFVVADFNNDGRLDIAACVDDSPEVRIWLNRTTAVGNWINVRLTGPSTNLVAIDATIRAYTAGHVGDANYLLTTVVNNTFGSPVHLSLNGLGHSQGGKLPIHIGLGTAASVDLRVSYPNGDTCDLPGLTTDQTVTTKDVPFVWSAVATADSYVLEVGRATGQKDWYDVNVGNVLTTTVTLLTGDTYYSRVKAYLGAVLLDTTTEQLLTI
jgi:hypothetical protein